MLRKSQRERKVMLLPGGERCASFGDSSYKGLWSVSRVSGRPSVEKRNFKVLRSAGDSPRFILVSYPTVISMLAE